MHAKPYKRPMSLAGALSHVHIPELNHVLKSVRL